tara:strand:+ start:419 stop:889 length:471 start_codon:yes stop_codon:yes gene_type:complete
MASEEYLDDEFDGDDDPGSIKSLRRAANRAKKLEAELNGMKREVAFQRAGLPMEDPRMKYFADAYNGELDEDSILDAAEAAGFIEFVDDEEEEEVQQPQADFGSQQRVMAASGGGEFEDVTEQAALMRMQEALSQGGTDAFLAVAQELGIPTNNDE